MFLIAFEIEVVSEVIPLLLTFNCEGKMAESRLVVGIVIVGYAMYIPGSPIKLSSTFMIAFYYQWTVAVVFKLRFVPLHCCFQRRSGNFLVCGTVYNLGS